MSDTVDPMTAVEIDPASPVPAYYQLYEALRSQLGAGPFAPGSRLSTERSIADSVGVSRQTVRQALARLEREGLVHRRQGDGTYVSEPRLDGSLRVLTGFTSELSRRGLRVRNRVLDLKLVTPPTAVGEALGIGTTRDGAVMLRRVRILDGAPATLETVWLPADRCAPLLDIAMENRSLYATLREQLGIEPHRAVERLGATVLDEFEASELDRRPGDPALLVERTTYDRDERPIEAVKSLLRADRFSFSAELDLDTTGVTADPDVE
jgi:GntR family transcriptional regulator